MDRDAEEESLEDLAPGIQVCREALLRDMSYIMRLPLDKSRCRASDRQVRGPCALVLILID
jgi:hypothetical protein